MADKEQAKVTVSVDNEKAKTKKRVRPKPANKCADPDCGKPIIPGVDAWWRFSSHGRQTDYHVGCGGMTYCEIVCLGGGE